MRNVIRYLTLVVMHKLYLEVITLCVFRIVIYVIGITLYIRLF